MTEHTSTVGSKPTILGMVPQNLRTEFFAPHSIEELESAAISLGGSIVWVENQQEFLDVVNSAAAHEIRVIVSSWGMPFLGADILVKLPQLKLLAHTGASVRPFVGPHFFEAGCQVTQAGDAMGRPVAEVALAFTMSLLHQTHRFSADLHAGVQYLDAQNRARQQHEILGARIGVVGASRTGRHYLEMICALGARPLIFDPFVTSAEAQALGAEKVGLEELMSSSQIVAVHAPSLPETHHMINAEMLALMPDGAGLVNTARSWIVDESALLEQARSGRIDVALDVFDIEPFGPDFGFLGLPNVLLTPHRAAGTVEGRLRGGSIVAAEVTRFVTGQELQCAISLADLDRMA